MTNEKFILTANVSVECLNELGKLVTGTWKKATTYINITDLGHGFPFSYLNEERGFSKEDHLYGMKELYDVNKWNLFYPEGFEALRVCDVDVISLNKLFRKNGKYYYREVGV